MREDGGDVSSARRLTPSGAAAAGLYLLFVAMSLLQRPGETTYDTRAELTQRPLDFLTGAFTLWHPDSNFGELQNQAYGYLFPQGTWFALAEWLSVPDWVGQRLWSALVLIVACEGARRVALAVGLPGHGALLAGIVFGFSPRLLGTLPVITAEALPGAVMPWVVLPGLLALRGRLAPIPAALLSGAAVVCMGGVNAVENAGSLPMAMIVVVWGVRRGLVPLAFLGQWLVAVVVASLWWALPLLVLAGYAPPFYEYVESARDTTALIGWSEAVRGDTHWVAYLITGDRAWWPAAHALVSDPTLVVISAVVAAIGWAGLAGLGIGLRTPLIMSALLGLVLLTIAHGTWVGSPIAEPVRAWLDGPLQIFRNVHKIDPVVRLPLAIGFGHAVAVAIRWVIARRPALATSRPLLVLAPLLLVISLGQPYVVNNTRTPGWDRIADPWQQARAWLEDHDDGTATLVVPGSGFAQQEWGWTIDEPLQVLGGVDRVVRSQVPLVPGQSIRYLDDLDRLISTGRGTPRLRVQLARAGIGRVVVRRDLVRSLTGSPHPGFAAVSLANGGLRSVARFGDQRDGGAEVEVLAVDRSLPLLRTTRTADVLTVRGAPESVLRLQSSGLVAAGRATVLEGEPGWEPGADVVTDGNQRRERAFGSGDEALSALMSGGEPWRIDRAVHDFPSVPGAGRVVARYDGLDALTASSSQGYADNFGSVTPQAAPYSAVDGDPDTRWLTSPATDPREQWVRLDFDGRRQVRAVSVLPVADDREVAPVRELEVRAGAQRVRLAASPSGAPSVAAFDGSRVGSVEVRVVRVGTRAEHARVGLREVQVDGFRPRRTFVVPGEISADSAWVFGSEPDRRACVISLGEPDCSVARIRSSEEPDGMDRTFLQSGPGEVRLRGRVVARATPEAARLLEPLGRGQQVGATSNHGSDPKVASRFAYDGQITTAWMSADEDRAPTLFFRWPSRRVITGLDVAGDSDAAPVAAIVRGDGRTQRVALAGPGTAQLPRPVRARELEVTFVKRPDADHVVVPELTLEGGRITRPFFADEPTGAACGLGPVVQVDGRRVLTRVRGTMADVVNGSPLRLASCTPGEPDEPLALGAGEHRLRAPTSAEFQVVQLAGIPERHVPRRAGRTRAVVPVRWGDTDRSAEVAPGAESLLFLPENYNSGWVATVDGERLRPLRVDGWQQAWVVPASDGPIRVDIDFRPQGVYGVVLPAGLVASGLLLLAGIVVLFLMLVRRRGAPATDVPWPEPRAWGPAALVACGVAAVLVAGPVPAVGLTAGVLAARRLPVSRNLTWVLLLVVGSAVVDVVWGAGWSRSAADALAALGVGLAAGCAIGMVRTSLDQESTA